MTDPNLAGSWRIPAEFASMANEFQKSRHDVSAHPPPPLNLKMILRESSHEPWLLVALAPRGRWSKKESPVLAGSP